MTEEEKLARYDEAIKLLERVKELILEAAEKHRQYYDNNPQV